MENSITNEVISSNEKKEDAKKKHKLHPKIARPLSVKKEIKKTRKKTAEVLMKEISDFGVSYEIYSKALKTIGDIRDFSKYAKESMRELKWDIEKKFDRLYHNSEMNSLNVLNDNEFFFPINIRRALLFNRNDKGFLKSCKLGKEYIRIAQDIVGLLEEIDDFKIVINPLVREVETLLLTYEHKIHLAERKKVNESYRKFHRGEMKNPYSTRY